MKVIKPTTMTPSLIVSSSLAETEAEWSSSTAYSPGAVVYYGYDGVYQAITSNTNKPPPTSLSDWVYLRPTNRWAIFDNQVSTSSSAVGSITLTVKTTTLQGMALLNLNASTVTVTVTDGLNGPVVYTATQSLLGEVYDWYQYFFYDTDIRRTQAIFIDLPLNYTDTYTQIVITGEASSTVTAGTFTFGKIVDIGKTEYGASAGIIDYSTKQTNEFGETTFVRRAYSKRLGARVLLNNAELNRIQNRLYELRAVPALWFASANPNFEEALVVFGYYRDFSIDISYPNYSYCSLEIEGLI